MIAATTVEQIDARIAAVRSALERIGQGLIDLDNDTTRQTLATSALSGQTAGEWARADDQIFLTWQCYLAVGDVMSAIVEQRGTKPRLSDDRIDALGALLSGPSVPLSTDPEDAARRARAGAPLSPPCTIDELLQTMSATFKPAAAVVAQTADVWNRVAPRLADFDATLTGVEQSAAAIGIRSANDVAVARRLMSELREQAAGDPLSLDDNALTTIATSVDRAKAAVEQATRAKGTLDDAVVTAQRDLDRIEQLLGAARRAGAETAVKILGAENRRAELTHAVADLDRLRADLGALRELAPTDWEGAARLLTQVNQRTGVLLDQAQRLEVATSAELAARNELRGRLDAYRAKALAVGRGEDLELDRIYQQAMGTLFTAPCDLTRAGQLVTAYQRALSPKARIEDR